MSDRSVPTNRLGRLARIASIGARIGVQAVTGASGDMAAKAAAETLGSLRGLAAKVGQMSAYVDGLVPGEHAASYETWMSGLLAATPRSSPDAVRRLIEDELGQPTDRLFVEFDEHPIASASIGQVHRARLEDGTEVAVKVQHPGIWDAVESDLANAGFLEGAIAMMGTSKQTDSKRILEEVRTRFREELDYVLEAERQRAFAELHGDDANIRVPRVIGDRSSKRVLTTEFVRGSTFEQARGATEAERRAFAETLWRFVFKGTIVGGMFNADPHPGNYFFHDGGGVTFIDYGCIQPLPVERRTMAARAHAAACNRDEAGFRDAARAMLSLAGGEHERKSLAYMRRAFEPLFGAPYHITREYTAELVQEFRAMAKDVVTGKEKSAVPLPEGVFFLNRLQFGFYSVCARLAVDADYASVERAFLPAEMLR